MKWFYTYFIWQFALFSFSQITLPAYKNGSWWLTDGKENIKLGEEVEYIGLFDSENYTFFIQNQKYGVLDNKGRIIIEPEFHSINSLGSSLFNCIDSVKSTLIDVRNSKNLLEEYSAVKNLNSNYVIVYKDTLQFLIHKESRRIHVYPDSITIEKNYLNTVLVEKENDQCVFHNPEGLQILIHRDSIDYFSRYILVKFRDESLLFTMKSNYLFKTSISYISIIGNFLSYYDGKFAHLLNLQSGDEIIKLPFQSIQPAYFGGYFVGQNQSLGWINDKLQVKIPLKYDYITKTGKNYTVYKNGLSGLYDSSFNLKIPCEFSYFVSQGEFIKVYSLVETKGLISNISNKMILAAVYDQIIIEKNIIKAYIDDKIRIIELSDNHQIKSDFILNNAVTANQKKPKVTDYRYDKRLLSLGWFFETREIIDSTGKIVNYNHIWGLKNADDSILIKPVYKNVTYYPIVPFSLISLGEKKYDLIGGQEDIKPMFLMKSHLNGKSVCKYKILEVDSLDCYNRNFVRFETTEGYKIWFKGDSVKSVNYVSSSQNTYLNYCIGGQPEFTEKTRESVPINHFSLNGKSNNFISFQNSLTKKWVSQILYKGAKWNYLDSNGQDLFEESFEYADEFYLNTAIVRRKSGWGLINKDSVIIPMKFAEIKRLKEFKDTVFLVKANHNKKFYLTSNSALIDFAFMHVKSLNNLSVVKSTKGYGVLNDGKIIAEFPGNVNLLSESKFVARNKKEYSIFDSEGNIRLTLKSKPEEIYYPNLILVSESGKKAILNFDGDTLLPFGKYEFEKKGKFITCRSSAKVSLYNHELKSLFESKTGELIYVDEYADQFAVLTNGKISVYDINGNKISKFKQVNNSPIILFQNGLFISKNCIFSEFDSINISKNENLILIDGGYVGIRNEINGTRIFYNSLTDNVVQINGRNIKYLGEKVFSFSTRKGLVLKNQSKEIILGQNSKLVDKFQEGFCLVKVNNEFVFLDSELKNSFNRNFEDATPFKNNMATVKEEKGWAIMNHQGILQSFPSFNRIEQLSKNLFETTEKATYGLYDSHGNELIAPIYESITIVSKDIIQVVKNGEIGYFDTKGISLFNIE